MTEWIASTVVLCVVLAVVPVQADPGEKAPVLSFWAGPGAKNDKRVIEVEDHHACSGQRAYARVSQMPTPNSKGPLQPELVVELSRSGGVVRRWSMPIDEIVLGVRGNRIIVPYRDDQHSDEKVLLISSDRSFSIAQRPSSLAEPSTFACPRIRDIGKSNYLRCFEFRDLASNAVRRLAYQGPCT